MKIDNPIPVIRALWGDREETLSEIPKTPMFKNEIVFVWGIKNKNYLLGLGYKVILVKDNLEESEDLSNLTEAVKRWAIEEHNASYVGHSRYSSPYLHFAHKLEALRLGDKIYGEYLFLDWDITLAKDIDEQFFEKIREKGNFQCPIYAYCEDWLEEIEEYLPDDDNGNMKNFTALQDKLLTRYSWKLNKLRVCPCACFIYSNHANNGIKLLDIMKKYKLETCVEEYAIFLLSNCSLDQYIKQYDPVVLNGKAWEQQSDKMTEAIKEINRYVLTKSEKDIYLYHDI